MGGTTMLKMGVIDVGREDVW